MKVDMSPKAVTERLRTLDDLWLLSVKLMNSKRVKSSDRHSTTVGEKRLTENLLDNTIFQAGDRNGE